MIDHVSLIAGRRADGTTSDMRGITRPRGTGSDAGAYEAPSLAQSNLTGRYTVTPTAVIG